MSEEMKRSDMARKAEQMSNNLEECNVTTMSQAEVTVKLEAKLQELRRDKEELSISWDATLLKLRRKHQEAHDEMADQTETLRKIKSRIDRDILAVQLELSETVSGQ